MLCGHFPPFVERPPVKMACNLGSHPPAGRTEVRFIPQFLSVCLTAFGCHSGQSFPLLFDWCCCCRMGYFCSTQHLQRGATSIRGCGFTSRNLTSADPLQGVLQWYCCYTLQYWWCIQRGGDRVHPPPPFSVFCDTVVCGTNSKHHSAPVQHESGETSNRALWMKSSDSVHGSWPARGDSDRDSGSDPDLHCGTQPQTS